MKLKSNGKRIFEMEWKFPVEKDAVDIYDKLIDIFKDTEEYETGKIVISRPSIDPDNGFYYSFTVFVEYEYFSTYINYMNESKVKLQTFLRNKTFLS